MSEERRKPETNKEEKRRCPEDCPGIVSCIHCRRMRRDGQCPLRIGPFDKVPENSPCHGID